MVSKKKKYPVYEYKIVWKREGWTSPMEKRFAKIESVLRQQERIETAKTWRGDPVPITNQEGDPALDEGPWDVAPLLYAKIQRRLVGKWEDFPDG